MAPLFPWRDYLTLAINLSKEPHEACLRSAISRAYYAAFCTCSEWYVAKYTTIPDVQAGSHGNVWEAFKSHAPDPTYVLIAGFGNLLKDRREEADYANPYPSDW